MNIQFISNSNGQTTGVFIPIEDWESLIEKYDVLKKEEQNMYDIPAWHKDIIDKRLAEHKENPENVIDFDQACDEIEQEL